LKTKIIGLVVVLALIVPIGVVAGPREKDKANAIYVSSSNGRTYCLDTDNEKLV